MSKNNRNRKNNQNPKPSVDLMPKSEHETAAKEWAEERHRLMTAAETANKEKVTADQTINNIVQHNNQAVNRLSKIGGYWRNLAVVSWIILLISITVNVVIVINNIGGLK